METLPFERVWGKRVGAGFAKLLNSNKVQFLGNTSVKLFRGETHVNGVELDSGDVCFVYLKVRLSNVPHGVHSVSICI